MPELETALRQLGRELELPPTPDLASAIRGRLERRRSWRRPVLIAVAIGVVAIGAVLLVPPARTAVLDWLGLGNVGVTRVDDLPPARPIGRLDLGREVTLAEAKRETPWLLVPSDEPDSIYLSDSLPGGMLSLVWGDPSEPRLLLTELTGRAYIDKVVDGESDVEPVEIGDAGAWFQGRHIVMFSDRDGVFHEGRGRLAANTLVWQLGDVTLRLEGDLSKEKALRIARTVRLPRS
jgi:hypothetical protein